MTLPAIAPLDPPYSPRVAAALSAMMPPGVAPLGLFRTFARNLPMTEAMHPWGRYELSAELSLTLRDREILIDRTCARTRCEYEWSVHVGYFADKAGFTPAQVTALTHGAPSDPWWVDKRDRLLVAAADALHADATIGVELWNELAAIFSEAQLLDLTVLCGWYHAVCFAANAARVPLEPIGPRFDEVMPDAR